MPPAPSDPPADPIRAAALTTRLYEELRTLAERRLRAAPAQETVQVTGLVHEAWLKLRDDRTFPDRGSFFGAASRAMRNVLVDRIRARLADKRGGGATPVDLPTGLPDLRPGSAPEDVLSLDAALQAFEAEFPDHAEIVVRRFFGGQTAAEVAADLGVTERTVERRWRFARAELARRLGPGFAGNAPA